MAGKRVWTAVLGLAGTVLGAGGCATPSGLTSAFTGTPVAATNKDELPHDKAIQASMAVAQTLEKAGSEAPAIEQYEKVLQLDPGNIAAGRRLAVLYDRAGDFDKADAQYSKLAKALPRDADLFNDWGYSYYERTKWAEAEKQLRHALALDPKHARARCNLGLALGQQGKYGEALLAFRAVVSEADAHCDLAFVFWSQGKIDEARAECRQAVQVDPANAKAPVILAQLDRPATSPTAALAAAAAPRQPSHRSDLVPAAFHSEPPTAKAAPLGNPMTLATGPAGEPLPRPVYQSPNGTAWVPVTPAAKPASPKEPVGGTEGSITWE
jgi:Flp pilus assembly protein TadD